MTGSLFLIPNATFFVELLVVLVILWVFAKKVLPPLNRAMAARQDQIRASMEAAEQAKRDAASADDERHRALDEARGQAREIVAVAQQTAEQVRTDAASRAQAEYDRIVGAAVGDIAAARQRAVEEASTRLGEVVVSAVTKIVGREIDASSHRDLMDEAISALGSGSPKGAGQTQ